MMLAFFMDALSVRWDATNIATVAHGDAVRGGHPLHQCEPDTPALARHCDRCCGSASARVPDVRMGAPAGSGTPRCGCGSGRGTAARPRAWTRRPRPTPRPLPPTGIHKLYGQVVASYLKNRVF